MNHLLHTRGGRWSPAAFVLGLLMLLLVACGTAATPTTAATAVVAPTTAVAAPATTAAPPATAAPTASSEASVPPTGGMMAEPEFAPSFSSYWTPATDFYGEPVYGGTMRVIYEDQLEHGNIWGAWIGATFYFRTPVHNTLFQRSPYDLTGPFVPNLAYGWTVHDDAQGVTFFFQEGIQWHNGAEFVCEDARFSLETMATGEGLTASYMKGELTHIDLNEMKCQDDYTLEIRFKTPTAVPMLSLDNPRTLIFNKKWFEEGAEQAMFEDVSVGTGPFKWAPGQTVGAHGVQRFERNPDYFLEGLPYLDGLTIISILDESAQQAAMLAHQGDWHSVRNWGQYDAYVNHDQIMTARRPQLGASTMWLNKRNPPFDNVRVRQAITMGIDRVAGNQVLERGYGLPAQGGLFPPGSAWELDLEQGCSLPGWCQPADGNMEQQRAEARQILEEEGFNFDKTYVMTVETDRRTVKTGSFLQEQFRLLGIKVEQDIVETVTERKMKEDGTWADIHVNHGQGLGRDDPHVGLGQFLRCDGYGNLWTPGTDCDAKMDQLFEELGSALDPAERKRLSDEIQLYAMEQYQYNNLVWQQEAAAFWPELRGYSHFFPGRVQSEARWSHVWMDPAHADDKGFKGQTTGVPGGF